MIKVDGEFKSIKFDENFKSTDILIDGKIYIAKCNEKTCYVIGNFIEEELCSYMFNWDTKIDTNYVPRNFPFTYTAKNNKAVMLFQDESLKDYEILVPIKKEVEWKERL